jgi:hypothetical protein
MTSIILQNFFEQDVVPVVVGGLLTTPVHSLYRL